METREIRKSSFVLLDQALVSGYNFILAICLTKWMGIEQYGLFVMMWMLVFFCSNIHQQYIIVPMQAFGGLEGQKKQDFYGQLLYQQLFFAALSWIGVWVFIQLGEEWFGIDMSLHEWLLPSVVFLFLMYDYFRKRFLVLQEAWKAFAFDLVTCGTQFAIIYYRMVVQGHTELDVLLRAITQGLSLGVFLGVYTHEYLTWDIPALVAQIRKHSLHSKWLVATSLTQWFAGNWFIVLAGALLGPAAIGAIRMAQNLLGLFHIPFLAIENYLPTKLVLLYQQGGIKILKQSFGKLSLYGGSLMIACLAVLSFFSHFIIELIYGTELVQYDFVVQGFSLMYVFVFFGTLFRIYLRTIQKTQYIFWGYVLNVVFAASLARYFIGEWELNGVLSGLIISQLIMLITLIIPVYISNVKKAAPKPAQAKQKIFAATAAHK